MYNCQRPHALRRPHVLILVASPVRHVNDRSGCISRPWLVPAGRRPRRGAGSRATSRHRRRAAPAAAATATPAAWTSCRRTTTAARRPRRRRRRRSPPRTPHTRQMPTSAAACTRGPSARAAPTCGSRNPTPSRSATLMCWCAFGCEQRRAAQAHAHCHVRVAVLWC